MSSSASPTSLLRKPEVSKRTGLSANRIDELEKAGRFPRRVRISDRAVGWSSNEIDAFVSARIAARDAQHPTRTDT
ncbi:MAG: helix-turn-helix transcriptional regulator [Steroidobacteraceae bacterium]